MHLRPTSKLGYLSFKWIDCQNLYFLVLVYLVSSNNIEGIINMQHGNIFVSFSIMLFMDESLQIVSFFVEHIIIL